MCLLQVIKSWTVGKPENKANSGTTALLTLPCYNILSQGYESVSTDPDDFEGKVVLILGRGDPFYSVKSLILTPLWYAVATVKYLLGLA